MPTDLGKKVRTVVEILAALALFWFCAWAGFKLAHISNGVDSLLSARDAQLIQRAKVNAINIEANTNRLDAIEENVQ